MHIPQPSIPSTIIKITTISAGLHEFVKISWEILIPYTIFGLSLMIYGHIRLMVGQNLMSSDANKDVDRVRANLEQGWKQKLYNILVLDPTD